MADSDVTATTSGGIIDPIAELFAPKVWAPKTASAPLPQPDPTKIPPAAPQPDWHHMFGFSTEAEAKLVADMLAPFGVTGPVEPDMRGGFGNLTMGEYRQYEIVPPNSLDHHNVGLLLLNIDRYKDAGWIMIRKDVLGV